MKLKVKKSEKGREIKSEKEDKIKGRTNGKLVVNRRG